MMCCPLFVLSMYWTGGAFLPIAPYFSHYFKASNVFLLVWTHIGILYTYAETSHKTSVMMDLIKLIPFNDHSITYQNSPGCLGGSPEFMSERSGFQHGVTCCV